MYARGLSIIILLTLLDQRSAADPTLMHTYFPTAPNRYIPRPSTSSPLQATHHPYRMSSSSSGSSMYPPSVDAAVQALLRRDPGAVHALEADIRALYPEGACPMPCTLCPVYCVLCTVCYVLYHVF